MPSKRPVCPTVSFEESQRFVERALLDFGLMDAFRFRPGEERVKCLHWIADAADSRVEEDRVSYLLDALAHGEALMPAESRVLARIDRAHQ